MIINGIVNQKFSNNLNLLYKFIGFRIDEKYALIAITCSDYGHHANMVNQDSLAIVGDHVLKLILSSRKLQSDLTISKEDMSTYYQSKESNEVLQMIGEKHKLRDFLLHSNNELDGNKKLATSIEAILGAVFLHSGFAKAIEFATRIGVIKPPVKAQKFRPKSKLPIR